MECCGEIREEHALIEDAAAVAMAMAVLLVQGREVADEDVGRLVGFGRDFVDERHYRKEERALFPALVASAPHPVSIRLRHLRADHAASRPYMERMPRRDAPEAAAEALAGWSRLMRAHVAEEDEALLPLAERTLSDEAKRAVVSVFHDVDESTPAPVAVGDLVDRYAAVPVG
ncbi:MAG: hemerythrin domain-containing protein [Coriobacteriia bacterium]|nr:hemerythrin domain-containing protein [Coriobacteriia bacterium]